MATLEQITRGSVVKGILPEGLVTISDVRWIGTVAIEVTYKDTAGKLGNELLYRDREPTLAGPGPSTATAIYSGFCPRPTASAWPISLTRSWPSILPW